MRMSATRFAVPFAAATLILAGCADSDGDTDDAATGGGTVTIENCGRTVSVESTPQRVVSLNQASTEILLSLGLGDRMVGTATWTDPVRENLAEANSSIPRLADNKPSLETVLEANPDFVTASFGSSIGDGGADGRDQYEKLGVPTYLSPTDNGCNGEVSSASNADGARTTPYTMDSVYQEVRELAAIFGVEERGEEFIGELEGRVRAASDPVDATGVTLAYWFADTRTPYMAGCCGSSGAITAAVGATNVFADTTDEWPQVPWETVADRDPTALVLADLSRRSIDGDALDSKIAFLEKNPVTAQMQAVRERRYIIVNGADLNPTIRTVDGIEKVAAALQDWNLATPRS
ncbi:ABC transporter substrate-binding protein [Gordonia lacunae]|uniref:ABC transporter substrate-binding protein n=1 Tax=Gordonia lacunae TaxID=417102 RepID=A0A243QDN8_9ACTN|nr:ABC transporter substrate-binding protein [Gordonia lacunae]OUC79861.1 ABC transporter substrate-binding protein [Gordonia lacunae]